MPEKLCFKETETMDEVQRDERQNPLRILTLLRYAFVTQNDLFLQWYQGCQQLDIFIHLPLTSNK